MRCPRQFSAQLESKLLLGVEVDQCPECTGIWLDAGELLPILGAMAPVAALERHEETCAEDEAPMRCPRCGAVAVLLATPPVKVNMCSACQGLWLDALELETLSALHSEGKLDGLLSKLQANAGSRA